MSPKIKGGYASPLAPVSSPMAAGSYATPLSGGVPRNALSLYPRIKLGDFVSLQRGHDLTELERCHGSIPIMGSAGHNGFHNVARAKGPGIVIGRSGSSFGQVHYSAVDFWPHNTALYVTDFKGNDERFTFYLLNSIDFSGYNSGSAQPSLNRNLIAMIEITTPPLPIQKAIAHILGTLDDRIELCCRMNETLEAMARALFKDWFIDFGPVRAKMEGREPPGLSPEIAALFPSNLVDSELGEIPEGWTVATLQEIIELNPTESLKKGATAPYIDMAALPTSGPCADNPVPREFGSGMKFRNGDTLIARITPCLENGKTAFVQHLPDNAIAWGSTEFIVMRPRNPVPAPFVYLLARDESFRECAIRSMTGTSGRQRAQASLIADYKIANPSAAVWKAFGEAISTSFGVIKSNFSRLAVLEQTRDTLLPKLLSGELTIPDAMLQVDET